MEAQQRAALVEQGKALKAQLADMEVGLQRLDSRLQVRGFPTHAPSLLPVNGDLADARLRRSQRLRLPGQ
jgi:hypothetical protein